MMVKNTIIYFISFYIWIVISLLNCYSQDTNTIVRLEKNGSDSAVVIYTIMGIDSLKEIDRISYFFFDKITWHYDKNTKVFYFIGTSLLNIGANGNVEMRMTFRCYSVLDLIPIKDISIVYYQALGNFRKVYIENNEVLFFQNGVIIHSIPVSTSINIQEIIDFLD